MLGMRLQQLREDRGWKMYEAAKRAEIAPWVVSRLERRVHLGNVQVRPLKRLADLYGVTVDSLIRDVPEEAEEIEPVNDRHMNEAACQGGVPGGPDEIR